jgi:hypothetical protein
MYLRFSLSDDEKWLTWLTGNSAGKTKSKHETNLVPQGEPKKHAKGTEYIITYVFDNLREERRLRVFENRVLRGMFGPKRDEVTGEWRKLHNEELNNLYSLPNIVRVVKSRRMR